LLLLLVVVILVCALVAYAISTALGIERPVGFQSAQTTRADGQPFAFGIWYPTEANPRQARTRDNSTEKPFMRK